jgi:PhnB protein
MNQPVSPYLTVKGAADAIAFYQKAFGAKEEMRMPAQDGKRLMHAHLTINGGAVFLSDEFPEHGDVAAPKNGQSPPVAVALALGKPAEVDATYKKAVGAGAKRHAGAGGHVLGRALRHADRPVRPPLDARRAAREDVAAYSAAAASPSLPPRWPRSAMRADLPRRPRR